MKNDASLESTQQDVCHHKILGLLLDMQPGFIDVLRNVKLPKVVLQAVLTEGNNLWSNSFPLSFFLVGLNKLYGQSNLIYGALPELKSMLISAKLRGIETIAEMRIKEIFTFRLVAPQETLYCNSKCQ